MEGNSIRKNSNIIYYFNDNTILKYLRKVLNEINNQHMDSSMKSAFILKRYLEKYKPLDDEESRKLVLLCLLKDIGVFYMDKTISNNALAAASSYCFLKNCSPFGDFLCSSFKLGSFGIYNILLVVLFFAFFFLFS